MAEQTPTQNADHRIVEIRGMKVILDGDLAELYGVETRTLNQAVRRNIERFPIDFLVQLTRDEKDKLVASDAHFAGLRFSTYLPLAYTECGVIMAAVTLHSQRAIEKSLFLVRAFIQLKVMIAACPEPAGKLRELEDALGTRDAGLHALVEVTRQLMAPPPPVPPEAVADTAADQRTD